MFNLVSILWHRLCDSLSLSEAFRPTDLHLSIKPIDKLLIQAVELLNNQEDDEVNTV